MYIQHNSPGKDKEANWRQARTDSLWYPTIRLYRQRERTEWGTVIEEVVDALRDLAGSHLPPLHRD
jgi:hypothetical protein